MGGEQAAKVLTIVAEDGAAARGVEPDRAGLVAMAERLVAQYEREGEALFATARLWEVKILKCNCHNQSARGMAGPSLTGMPLFQMMATVARSTSTLNMQNVLAPEARDLRIPDKSRSCAYFGLSRSSSGHLQIRYR